MKSRKKFKALIAIILCVAIALVPSVAMAQQVEPVEPVEEENRIWLDEQAVEEWRETFIAAPAPEALNGMSAQSISEEDWEYYGTVDGNRAAAAALASIISAIGIYLSPLDPRASLIASIAETILSFWVTDVIHDGYLYYITDYYWQWDGSTSPGMYYIKQNTYFYADSDFEYYGGSNTGYYYTYTLPFLWEN